MWLVHEIADLRAEPVIATRGTIAAAHALLDDCPLAFGADEEAVVVNAEAILDRGRIDLGGHAAIVGQPPAIDSGALAVFDKLNRCASRSFSFTAGDENPNFILSLREAFLQCAADGRGDTARVPIETEHAAERLEPMWVGKPTQKLGSAVLENHHLSNGWSKLSHTLK